MENKTAEEVNQVEQVNPAPATEPVAKQEPTTTVDVKPTEANVEKKKEASAFIKMRIENRELKRQLAAMATPTPATPQTEAPAPTPAPVVAPAPSVPAQNNAVNLEEERKALDALATDPDLAKMPNGLIDVMEMVDADPRLSKLRDFDPTIAYREAKTAYLAKAGVTAAPPVPVAHTPAGGVGGGGNDLAALVAECEKLKPGTKEFNSLVKKINAEMGKLHRL